MKSIGIAWKAVAQWRAPVHRATWVAAKRWAPAFERLTIANATAVGELFAEWDRRLHDLGGDPARMDWSRFRPLRLSREEDWSDWLGHLLEHSTSGRFSARLFSGTSKEAEAWKVTRVQREVVADDYRADLVVHFQRDAWAHVEIKVGDLSLAKTVDTGAALQRHSSVPRRGDFLLLPERDVPAWRAQAAQLGEPGTCIQVRTWHDVARALRLSIDEPFESSSWRAWALAFVGAVEQVLLELPRVPLPLDGGAPSYRLRRVDVLRRYLESIKEEP